jgi:hypothetical protein
LHQHNLNFLSGLVCQGVEHLSPKHAEILIKRLLSGWTIGLQIQPDGPAKKVGEESRFKPSLSWLASPPQPRIESPQQELRRKNLAQARKLIAQVKREERARKKAA